MADEGYVPFKDLSAEYGGNITDAQIDFFRELRANLPLDMGMAFATLTKKLERLEVYRPNPHSMSITIRPLSLVEKERIEIRGLEKIPEQYEISFLPFDTESAICIRHSGKKNGLTASFVLAPRSSR